MKEVQEWPMVELVFGNPDRKTGLGGLMIKWAAALYVCILAFLFLAACAGHSRIQGEHAFVGSCADVNWVELAYAQDDDGYEIVDPCLKTYLSENDIPTDQKRSSVRRMHSPEFPEAKNFIVTKSIEMTGKIGYAISLDRYLDCRGEPIPDGVRGLVYFDPIEKRHIRTVILREAVSDVPEHWKKMMMAGASVELLECAKQ